MGNLLPHKSWNVWNRDNREKVERDQAAARGVEEQKKKRVLEIEQERRYDELKSRSKKFRLENGESAATGAGELQSYQDAVKLQNYHDVVKEEQASKHINFFQELELGLGPITKVDKLDEKPEPPKLTLNQQINGVAKTPTSDFEVPTPWYSKTKEERDAEKPQLADEQQKDEAKRLVEKNKRDSLRKDKADPMMIMNMGVNMKKQIKVEKENKVKEDKRKADVEKLRQERMERELAERKKVEALLASRQPKPSTSRDPQQGHSRNNYSSREEGGHHGRSHHDRQRDDDERHSRGDQKSKMRSDRPSRPEYSSGYSGYAGGVLRR